MRVLHGGKRFAALQIGDDNRGDRSNADQEGEGK